MEPLRNHGDHGGATAGYAVQAPRLRCDRTSTAEARRNMIKVAAVPPRRSAVLTVFRGATAINDGTTAEPRSLGIAQIVRLNRLKNRTRCKSKSSDFYRAGTFQ